MVINLDDALACIVDLALPALDAARTWIIHSTLPNLKAAWAWIKTFSKVLVFESNEHLRKGIDITQIWLGTWTKPIIRADDDNTLTYKTLPAATLCVMAIRMFLPVTYELWAYSRLQEFVFEDGAEKRAVTEAGSDRGQLLGCYCVGGA